MEVLMPIFNFLMRVCGELNKTQRGRIAILMAVLSLYGFTVVGVAFFGLDTFLRGVSLGEGVLTVFFAATLDLFLITLFGGFALFLLDFVLEIIIVAWRWFWGMKDTA